MKKLGTLLLALCHVFDMIACWCFIGLVLEKSESTVQLDFEAAGQDYAAFRTGYFALAVIQTIIVAPVRLKTCYQDFKGQNADKKVKTKAKGKKEVAEMGAKDDEFGMTIEALVLQAGRQ